jgi:hypothetical protein
MAAFVRTAASGGEVLAESMAPQRRSAGGFAEIPLPPWLTTGSAEGVVGGVGGIIPWGL